MQSSPPPFPLTQDDCHTNWVSCVRFSPNAQNPVIVSCGWDKLVKVGRRLGHPSSPSPFHPLTPYHLGHPSFPSPFHPFTLSPPHPLPSGSPLLPFTLSPPHPLPSGSPLLPFTLSPPHPLPSGSPLLPFTLSPPHPLPTGVEPNQLQAKDQPFWPQWFSQLCDRVTRWLTLCVRRKGVQTASAQGG